MPELISPSGALTTDLTHVVFTHDAAGAENLYRNNSIVASGSRSGDFSNWDTGYQLALATSSTLHPPPSTLTLLRTLVICGDSTSHFTTVVGDIILPIIIVFIIIEPRLSCLRT